jgi:hypothetical protein
MGWLSLAKYCEETLGGEVDYDEEFFICPECGEPIYADDYSDSELVACGCCPVCGMYLDDAVPVEKSIEDVVDFCDFSDCHSIDDKAWKISRKLNRMFEINDHVLDKSVSWVKINNGLLVVSVAWVDKVNKLCSKIISLTA